MPNLSEDFKRVSENRASHALARHMVDEIADCRGVYKPVARKRWIWELIQNAKDCAKDKPFQFNVTLKQDRLIVWHDAGPFTLDEVVCLVEGDSSKARRSAETTGKYGKGFLVTHVISTDVEVRGILRHERDGDFSFRFRLRRDGSDGAVLRNIAQCREDLDLAQPFKGDVCRTEFVYYVSSKEGETRDCILDTITALKNHVPYLFAFIPTLQRLTLGIEGEESAEFSRCDPASLVAPDVPAEAQRVDVNTQEGLRSVLHFTPLYPRDKDRSSIAVPLLKENGSEFIALPTTVARIFQDLPLHATLEFALPVVLNLPRQCDVDSNRAMPDFEKEATADAIKFGLALLPSIARWALREGKVGGGHRLANLGPATPLAQNPDAARRWLSAVIPVIDELRRSKIVTSETGTPLTPEEAVFAGATWLDFPADPELLIGTRELLAMRGDDVASAEVALEWDEILRGWEELRPSAKFHRTTLKDVFSEVANCKALTVLQRQRPKLSTPEDAVAYLRRLFEIAAEYCNRHQVEAPTGLGELPVVLAQSGLFAAGTSLSLDAGIDNVLKDISAVFDKPFRTRLVDERLAKGGDTEFIKRLCNNRTYEQKQAVAELVTLAEMRFQSKQRGPEAEKTKAAAVKLMVWFAANRVHAPENLRSFPVLCQDQDLHSASESGDALIAPVGMIAADDAMWLAIFPSSVRMADSYVKTADALGVSGETVAQFLAIKSIASSTLVFERRVSSEESFFPGMEDGLRAEIGHTVEAITAKDVAGFTRLLNATGNVSRTGEWNTAEQVMRLVLCRLVVADQSWRSAIAAGCTGTHRCSGSVNIYPTAWMGKLRTHPWLPGDGSSGCEPLNAKNLDRLLDRIGNEFLKETAARDFLALHFGLNPLDLALRAKAGDDAAQLAELRQQWAGVVELDVPPQVVREMVERHRTASAISTRNNQLGKAVELLAAQALRDEGFVVEPTGIGSDFRAALVEPRDPDWSQEDIGEVVVRPKYGSTLLEFLVEVKATCSDSVRMSRIQGETASQQPNRYVLCVVDFRNQPEQFTAVMAQQNDASIAGCLSLIPDIGIKLMPAVNNLASAERPATPGIELEKADEIRFRIQQQIWQPRNDLKSWTAALRQSLVSGPSRSNSKDRDVQRS